MCQKLDSFRWITNYLEQSDKAPQQFAKSLELHNWETKYSQTKNESNWRFNYVKQFEKTIFKMQTDLFCSITCTWVQILLINFFKRHRQQNPCHFNNW